MILMYPDRIKITCSSLVYLITTRWDTVTIKGKGDFRYIYIHMHYHHGITE